ncbi:hypothetical protein CEXT_609841 [Caerostris extrusa]|uniref:Uncharacterized protein n=1 Tax=Caerostris extrusa TaxID=172846 RepID=A0AAV4NVU3_CAEEX|nr:hypothetical protein CEXT_609841 [Caerostris extrusa]
MISNVAYLAPEHYGSKLFHYSSSAIQRLRAKRRKTVVFPGRNRMLPNQITISFQLRVIKNLRLAGERVFRFSANNDGFFLVSLCAG